MQLAAFPPLPLESAVPPTGYAGSERAPSDLSTTTAFNTSLHARDIFFGQCCCIVCGRHGKVLKNSYIIPKIERDDTVSQIRYTYPFSNINIGHSGQTLRTVVGCLNRLKIDLNTNHATALCCVHYTVHSLTDIKFLSVSFPK